MDFPQTLDPYFQRFENNNNEDLHEWAVYSNLVTFIQQNEVKVTPEVSAELMAFQFIENHTGKASIWGSYFQPLSYFKDEEDHVTQTPDPALLNESLFEILGFQGKGRYTSDFEGTLLRSSM